MSVPSNLPVWQELHAHHAAIADLHLRDLFAACMEADTLLNTRTLPDQPCVSSASILSITHSTGAVFASYTRISMYCVHVALFVLSVTRCVTT